MTTHLLIGRRVATIDDIERPGDYCGPVDEVNAADAKIGTAVWFLLPTADPLAPFAHYSDEIEDILAEVKADPVGMRAAFAAKRMNGLHRVSEPPWTFRECPDGSLEIRASILCGQGDPEGAYFHGFLDEGHVWREC